MKRTLSNKKGFTLVELMLVMAIIVILASVLFIGAGAAIDNAKAKIAALQIHTDEDMFEPEAFSGILSDFRAMDTHPIRPKREVPITVVTDGETPNGNVPHGNGVGTNNGQGNGCGSNNGNGYGNNAMGDTNNGTTGTTNGTTNVGTTDTNIGTSTTTDTTPVGGVVAGATTDNDVVVPEESTNEGTTSVGTESNVSYNCWENGGNAGGGGNYQTTITGGENWTTVTITVSCNAHLRGVWFNGRSFDVHGRTATITIEVDNNTRNYFNGNCPMQFSVSSNGKPTQFRVESIVGS